MTAVVVDAHAAPPPPDVHPVSVRPPQQRPARPAARPTIAVTLQVTLCDDVPDPAAALRELVDRVREISDVAVLASPWIVETRHADGGPAVHPDTVRLDAHARTVSRSGTEIALCRREFDLLLFLAEHTGQVFTRGQLLNAIWQDRFTGQRTVDVHIRRLRQKLGARQPVITTVRGVGYRLATGAPITVVPGPTGAPHATSPIPQALPAGPPTQGPVR